MDIIIIIMIGLGVLCVASGVVCYKSGDKTKRNAKKLKKNKYKSAKKVEKKQTNNGFKVTDVSEFSNDVIRPNNYSQNIVNPYQSEENYSQNVSIPNYSQNVVNPNYSQNIVNQYYPEENYSQNVVNPNYSQNIVGQNYSQNIVGNQFYEQNNVVSEPYIDPNLSMDDILQLMHNDFNNENLFNEQMIMQTPKPKVNKPKQNNEYSATPLPASAPKEKVVKESNVEEQYENEIPSEPQINEVKSVFTPKVNVPTMTTQPKKDIFNSYSNKSYSNESKPYENYNSNYSQNVSNNYSQNISKVEVKPVEINEFEGIDADDLIKQINGEIGDNKTYSQEDKKKVSSTKTVVKTTTTTISTKPVNSFNQKSNYSQNIVHPNYSQNIVNPNYSQNISNPNFGKTPNLQNNNDILNQYINRNQAINDMLYDINDEIVTNNIFQDENIRYNSSSSNNQTNYSYNNDNNVNASDMVDTLLYDIDSEVHKRNMFKNNPNTFVNNDDEFRIGGIDVKKTPTIEKVEEIGNVFVEKQFVNNNDEFRIGGVDEVVEEKPVVTTTFQESGKAYEQPKPYTNDKSKVSINEKGPIGLVSSFEEVDLSDDPVIEENTPKINIINTYDTVDVNFNVIEEAASQIVIEDDLFNIDPVIVEDEKTEEFNSDEIINDLSDTTIKTNDVINVEPIEIEDIVDVDPAVESEIDSFMEEMFNKAQSKNKIIDRSAPVKKLVENDILDEPLIINKEVVSDVHEPVDLFGEKIENELPQITIKNDLLITDMFELIDGDSPVTFKIREEVEEVNNLFDENEETHDLFNLDRVVQVEEIGFNVVEDEESFVEHVSEIEQFEETAQFEQLTQFYEEPQFEEVTQFEEAPQIEEEIVYEDVADKIIVQDYTFEEPVDLSDIFGDENNNDFEETLNTHSEEPQENNDDLYQDNDVLSDNNIEETIEEDKSNETIFEDKFNDEEEFHDDDIIEAGNFDLSLDDFFGVVSNEEETFIDNESNNEEVQSNEAEFYGNQEGMYDENYYPSEEISAQNYYDENVEYYDENNFQQYDNNEVVHDSYSGMQDEIEQSLKELMEYEEPLPQNLDEAFEEAASKKHENKPTSHEFDLEALFTKEDDDKEDIIISDDSQETPVNEVEEEFDMSSIFNNYNEEESEKVEKEEPLYLLVEDDSTNNVVTEPLFDGGVVVNVFDGNANPLSKDDFINNYVNDINIFDSEGNIISNKNIEEKLNDDEIIVLDNFGVRVIKLVLLKEINECNKLKEKNSEVISNIFNEFNKPVTKEELFKEYSKNDPHLYYADKNKINKDEIIDEITSDELVVGEYGKKISSKILLKELKDLKTKIYDKNNTELSKEELIAYYNDNQDLYDKYHNHLSNEDLYNKVNDNLIVTFDSEGNKISKEKLLIEVFGYLDVYNNAQDRLKKTDLINYLDNNDLHLYDKTQKLLTPQKIVKILNSNNIDIKPYETLLLGVKSNVVDEKENYFDRKSFVKEYRNTLPKIYNLDGKRYTKESIVDYIKDETIIVVDKSEVVSKYDLIKELTVNIYGVFTKDKEELSKEELLFIINTEKIYDFNNKVLKKEELIKKIQDGSIVIYDINKKYIPKEDMLKELNKEYVGVYDLFQNQLTKEDLISQLNNNNKIMYDDVKMILSNEDIIEILKENKIENKYENLLSIREQQRPFLDFSKVELTDIVEDEYFETLDIVLAKKEDSKVVIVTYNKSYEARLNLSDDILKDYYTALKNKILSFNKVKSKVSWSNESFVSGKVQFAKIDVENGKIYLYLPLNWNDFINTRFKYKDCSNIKGFENTPLRFKISGVRELIDCYELIDEVAMNLSLSRLPNFVQINYYEKNRGFDILLKEGLIKELVNSKRSKVLTVVDKKTLISNKITSINKDVIIDIPLDDELYREVIIGMSKVEKTSSKAIISLDTISKKYLNDEVVSLESLKEKNLISDYIDYVKCVSRGSIDKKLTFKLQEYSKNAIKMILLTNGKIE